MVEAFLALKTWGWAMLAVEVLTGTVIGVIGTGLLIWWVARGLQ